MRAVSVCSSVGGLDLGLHRAGHQTVAFCEVDPWRRKVLARHWPAVPVFPDLKGLRAADTPPCDLLVGGTPCQDLSQAGKRAGLDGERSGLFHAFAQLRLDLFDLHGCAWSIWENVAGALSSNKGHDFATVLASHVGADVPVPAAGWGSSGLVAGPWGTAEWRLLDAQFFGVPQRRRRVFVVGHLGADHPIEVLADSEGGSRHPAPRRGATTKPPAGSTRGADEARVGHATGSGQGCHIVAGTLKASTGASGGGYGHEMPLVAQTLTARYRKGPDSDASAGQVVAATLTSGSHGQAGRRQEDDVNLVAGTLRSHPRPGSNSVGAVVAFHQTQDPISGAVSPALGVSSSGMGVAFAENQQGELYESPVTNSLTGGGGKPGQGYAAARIGSGVRRLTPTEWERLMGWPDGWTIDYGPSLVDFAQSWPTGVASPVDPPPDGRRYSACGDGVAAHVAEWIGLQLAAVAEDRMAVAA